MGDNSWDAQVNEIVARAMQIADDPTSATVRGNTGLGMGQHQRGLTFGIAAALMEELGNLQIELAPPADSPELSELKAENASLREQLEGPFTAPAKEPAAEEETDPALDAGVPYEDLTPAQKRRRTMAEKDDD